jgi:acetylglutamate kinase
MEVVQMVLCGKVNKDITALIQNAGGRALGLCGIDGAMLQARKLHGEEGDLGLVGEIIRVDASALEDILSAGTIPVVSSVAIGAEEDKGRVFNVNADTAAAKIAAAMGAEKLILMTDVRGILKDPHDENSLIKAANKTDLEDLKKSGIISKGMIPKVDCCVLALEGKVKNAHIIDGRLPHSLLIELFTDEGIGTMIQ